MINLKHIASEFMSALCVLALVFLSFTHHSAPSIDPISVEAFEVAAISFCGDAPADEHSANAPCHACRAAALVLPTPPCQAEPAYARFITRSFINFDDAKPFSNLRAPHRSRAPPVLI